MDSVHTMSTGIVQELPSSFDEKKFDHEQQAHEVELLRETSQQSDMIGRQIKFEETNTIKYRTCSWQKTAALLFSEYICIAIMSFPWSFSVLGLVPALILTFMVALIVLYTSLTIWRYCLLHPEIRDICDLSQNLFWGSKAAWYFTASMFLANNTFIQGLHCLIGAKYLNTMTGHPFCTIAFAIITALISFVFSLPRTFNTLSLLGTFSAVFTLMSVILATIFAAVEDHPAGWSAAQGAPVVLAIPAANTTFVQGLNAFLNISFTFIGQITIPSFIAEMKEPRDFWKSVLLVTVAEVILYSLVGAVIYVYTGAQYIESFGFANLGNDLYLKVSFSFMIPTLIFLGVLYASVSARFIFFRLFEGTRHKAEHTLIGWASWAGILLGLWILAWVIAEVIPFFSSLLSIMSSIFGSFFGFIFWGVAWLRMYYAKQAPGYFKRGTLMEKVEYGFNIALILIGLFFLGPGIYASIDSVVENYRAGGFGSAFSCANNGLGN